MIVHRRGCYYHPFLRSIGDHLHQCSVACQQAERRAKTWGPDAGDDLENASWITCPLPLGFALSSVEPGGLYNRIKSRGKRTIYLYGRGTACA